MAQFEFNDLWDRICSVTKWNQYSEMAKYLEIKSPSVTGAKNRGYFPIEWAIKIALDYDVNINWLLTGTIGKLTETEPVLTNDKLGDKSERFIITSELSKYVDAKYFDTIKMAAELDDLELLKFTFQRIVDVLDTRIPKPGQPAIPERIAETIPLKPEPVPEPYEEKATGTEGKKNI